MTIIAFKDGIMASDSQGTIRSMVSYGAVKMHQIGKAVVGISGDAYCTPIVLAYIKRWLCRAEEWTEFAYKPEKPECGYDCLIYFDSKLYRLTEGQLPYEIEQPNTVGYAWMVATTAMHLGQSAEEAVKTCIELDMYCGGAVQVVDCKDLTW